MKDKDISVYLKLHRNELINKIEDMFKPNKSIKGHLSLVCAYKRQLANGENQKTYMYYSLIAEKILNVDDFDFETE